MVDPRLMEVVQRGDVCVLRFADDQLMDPAQVERIAAQLTRLAAEAETPKLVICLENVTHVSSLMMGVLVSQRTEAEARGGDLKLASVPEGVSFLMKLTSLDKAFGLYDSVEEACTSF